MPKLTRAEMLDRIRAGIEGRGYFLYQVVGKQTPRFTYTIGRSQSSGAELIMAGASYYSGVGARQVVDEIVRRTSRPADGDVVALEGLGEFSLHAADGSWTEKLLLGALDYYGTKNVPALQVVPQAPYWTVDVPDLSRRRTEETEPVWQWLTKPWTYPVPEGSKAATNLDALRGAPVTEAVRWEDDLWELFAGEGPGVPKSEMREVPLGTLLGADPSLVRVVELQKEQGLWRDVADLEWHVWKNKGGPDPI